MQKYTIEALDIKDYDKCSNIWDMKKCPYTQQFKNQMMSGDRLVWIYKLNGEFIGEGAFVTNNSDTDYYIPNQRIYLSRMIVKKNSEIRVSAESSLIISSEKLRKWDIQKSLLVLIQIIILPFIFTDKRALTQ